jgi:hypothetical protein
MRILCLHAPSQYQLMNAFLDAVGDGFRASGHQVLAANLQEISPPGPPSDLVLSFGGVGAGVGLDAPLLTWLVDNPVWTPELYDLQVEKDGLLVVAGEHVEVLHDFLDVPTPTGFVPHGIEVDPEFGLPDFSDRERDIDVLVAGSFAPKPQPPWTTSEPAAAATLKTTLQIADERWDHHVRELEVSGLFLEAAQAHGLPYVPAGHRLFAPQLAWLDGHLRDRRRLAAVRALDRAGIKTHLVGHGWERLANLEHATVTGPIRHRELHELVRRTKILANVGPPLFNIGWHERVPLGMAHGAFVVTETNDWLTEEPEFAALFGRYEMPKCEELGVIVRGALADPTRADRTLEAYPVVLENHTWSGRAKTILEIVEV